MSIKHFNCIITFSADANFDSTYHSNFLVYNTGEVNWIPPGIIKSTCRIDITWFPFDDQFCWLKVIHFCKQTLEYNIVVWFVVVSWICARFANWCRRYQWQLSVWWTIIYAQYYNSAHQMDLSEYVVNGEWELLATPANRSVTFFKCCPEPYPTIQFAMHIRRRTLYYVFNLIIPSLLISLMTVLGNNWILNLFDYLLFRIYITAWCWRENYIG